MIDKINGGGITAPLGFMASSGLGDIKGKGRTTPDVAILVSDSPCEAAALFTTNIVKAAPVIYDSKVIASKSKITAIVANSGNANACTGKTGIEACEIIAAEAGKILDTDKNSVLVASTGVIGNAFPAEKIIKILPDMAERLSDDGGLDFAQAIMTTDTRSKESAVIVASEKGNYVIGGCCKGAGMIAPGVATMLTFLATDATISSELLNKALREAADVTFNCVTVDGDMSTNDSVFILANGMSGAVIGDKEYKEFVEALKTVCDDLARMMAGDGEGATKLVTVKVKNAKTHEEARLCAAKIANSPLVKTMFAGCDPNWGRLLASAGASGAIFDPSKAEIWFDKLHYVKDGVIIDVALEKDAYGIMKKDEYEITLDLHAGSSSAKFYTCDFTADYVRINADYRS